MAGAVASPSLFGSAGSQVPAVKAATSGILNVTAKFIVPIACLATGWYSGSWVWGFGDFLGNFVPGMQTLGDWVGKRDGSIHINHMIAGALFMAIGLGAAYLVKSFLGDGLIAEIMFRGIVGYVVGAGLRTMVHALGPLKWALDKVAGS